jgi:hypothetical protein
MLPRPVLTFWTSDLMNSFSSAWLLSMLFTVRFDSFLSTGAAVLGAGGERRLVD